MRMRLWGALALCLLAGLPAYAGTPFDEFLASRPLAATTLGATDKMPIVQGDETRALFPLSYFMRPDGANATLPGARTNLGASVSSGIWPASLGGTGVGTLTGLVLGNGSAPMSAYTGASCTNQFPRSLSAAGAATCASVANADLAGSIAASKLVGSDIVTVGTIGTGAWQGSLVAGLYGGTGVANSGKTITLGGNLVTSGAFATTLTATATTGVTLPTTGTLATLAGVEALTNKTLTSPTMTAPALGTPASGVATNLTGTAVGLTAGKVVGTTTNDNAAAGMVGEFISAATGPVSITTNTQTSITSISLTAGDWDVEGVILFDAAASTVVAFVSAGISPIAGTLPSAGTVGRVDIVPPTTAGSDPTIPTGRKRVSIPGTTTIYLVGFATFTVSTITTSGEITARRVR